MTGLVVCPVCPGIAEKKNRPMRQGDCSYVEMKRIPYGVGGYCGKCSMFGYETTIRQVQESNPETGEIRLKYVYETNYPDYPKPKKPVNDKSAEYETLFKQLYDELGTKIVSDVVNEIGNKNIVEAEEIKDMVDDMVKKAIEIEKPEPKKRGRPKKDE